MASHALPAGTIHDKVPGDFFEALIASEVAENAWRNITVLARNEWICWVEGAKLIDTRKRRVERAVAELAEGMRRPCCWPGCMHRTDKPLSPSQKWVLDKNTKKNI